MILMVNPGSVFKTVGRNRSPGRNKLPEASSSSVVGTV